MKENSNENDKGSVEEPKVKSSVTVEQEQGINPFPPIVNTTPSTTLQSFSVSNFGEIEQAAKALEYMKQIASVFIGGKLCPLKTEADVIIAMVTGNQLGIPYMSAINYIYPINGKPAVSTHIYRALILKAGIIFNKVEDKEPLYRFMKATKNAEGKIVPVLQNNAPIVLAVERKDYKLDGLYIIGDVPFDYRTTYEAKRYINTPKGLELIQVRTSFTYLEAVNAGLLDKDNWKNYLGRMLDARAFTFMSREIAADITLGLYTISELADANNIKYTMSDSFEETIEAEVIK